MEWREPATMTRGGRQGERESKKQRQPRRARAQREQRHHRTAGGSGQSGRRVASRRPREVAVASPRAGLATSLDGRRFPSRALALDSMPFPSSRPLACARASARAWSDLLDGLQRLLGLVVDDSLLRVLHLHLLDGRRQARRTRRSTNRRRTDRPPTTTRRRRRRRRQRTVVRRGREVRRSSFGWSGRARLLATRALGGVDAADCGSGAMSQHGGRGRRGDGGGGV